MAHVKGIDASKATPGRCGCCGCLMILVRLQDGRAETRPHHHTGWHCMVCGKTVTHRAMAQRYDRFLVTLAAPRAASARMQVPCA